MKYLILLMLVLTVSCSSGSMDVSEAVVLRRPAAVAGAFYPGDSTGLANMVDSLLGVSKAEGDGSSIISGVVPHAGYVYSGGVAADLYGLIQGQEYDLVFIIGPSHQMAFQGMSVFAGDVYETPLGDVPVARDVSERLIAAHADASFIPSVHQTEHGIEVQLPFLQRVLARGFRIVPIVTGSTGPEQLRFMAELILAEAGSARILVLASSDLSHYPPEDVANIVDQATVERYLESDPDRFFSALFPETYPEGVSTFACGGAPMTLVLCYNSIYPESDSRLISRATSVDAGGDPSGVVGYAAIVSESPFGNPTDWQLSHEERVELMSIAVLSVESAVNGFEFTVPEIPSRSGLMLPRGAFVTLKMNGALRGCIGSIRPLEPLAMTVTRMARSAALEDPRFSRVSPSELPDLEYEISVMSPLQILADWRDVRVGTDGLLIISDRGSGLLLPQVPLEQGWNTEEFLEGVCRKAGLPPEAYLGNVILYRFQAEVFQLE